MGISAVLVGSLDCRHLNIYVPNKATSRNRLPILVWIYGGGFKFGFAGRFLYGPKYIVRNDIILVTVKYRLGRYGFICLDTAEIPGNQGLKDQLSALRWVKDNIDAFGGKVNKVTIFGESAGGVSVDFHLRSAQEKLFDKVIMHSGTIVCQSHTFTALKRGLRALFNSWHLDWSNTTLLLKDTRIIRPLCTETSHFTGSTKAQKIIKYKEWLTTYKRDYRP